MKYLFLLAFIFFISCKEVKRDSIVTVRRGNEIIKGHIINDTLFNDTIKFYNLNNTLVSSRVYKDGKEDGISIEFYPNGKPLIVSSYSNGLKNGYNSYFDSLGKCLYTDFYYYDLTVGPIVFFDEQGSPQKYFFSNLQNETLLYIDYRKWRGIKDAYSNCINFTTNRSKNDSTKQISVFLYLIKPPKFSFIYSIFKKKKELPDKNFLEVRQIKDRLPFAKILLPILPDDEEYSIGVNIYDSLVNKQTIIYKDFP